MSYCHTCRRDVAFRKVEDHAFTDEHWDNEEVRKRTDNDTWCPLCECRVPRSNFKGHIDGRGHQHLCDHSDELSEDDEVVVDLRVADIHYSQVSIGCRFQDDDETSLDDGIQNIRNGRKYRLEVVYVNGMYVTLNNRTLYCYKKGGRRKVEAVVVNRNGLRGRKVCGLEIKVRGQDDQ